MQAWLAILFPWRGVVLAALLMAGGGAMAAAEDPAAPAGSGVLIQVATGNWGSADPRDIQLVLDSVASEFRPFVARPTPGVVKVRVIPRATAPRVLYERGAEGEYVVQLTARDERWFQYAYQFAHELCHILSNFDHKERHGDTVATGNQWFEESLCETASLFTLKRMAVSWEAKPPGRKWIGYGPMFASYAERLLAETHRHLPANQSFVQWYEDNRVALRDNPYLREKNELVATMLLPMFEQDPRMWQAISYLNASPASAAKPFSEYLADWHGACPKGTQEHVGKAMSALGAGVPSGPSWLARFGNKKPPVSQPEVSTDPAKPAGQ